jgi:hypothetical protein
MLILYPFIGMWTLNGQLSLIDRKKNLFKLSQGEYIAVEKVEGILGQSSLISQVFSFLMPYWLVYISHVEDRFFNTPRL